MIAQVNGDPWIDAWGKLKACIRSGASEQEATEYARELGRGLLMPMTRWPTRNMPTRCNGSYGKL